MAIDWWNLSREYVDKMYKENLGRDADDAGREYWVSELASGRITPTQLGERLRSTEITPFTLALQDPTYAAFLRGADFEQSSYESALAAAKDRKDRTIAQKAPWYDEQRKRGLQAAATDWENRGMYRAGGRLMDESRRTTDIDQQEADWRQGLADAYGDKVSQTNQATSAITRRKMEEEQAARQRLTMRDGETAAMKLAAGG
jgi:hypothetical protein